MDSAAVGSNDPFFSPCHACFQNDMFTTRLEDRDESYCMRCGFEHVAKLAKLRLMPRDSAPTVSSRSSKMVVKKSRDSR